MRKKVTFLSILSILYICIYYIIIRDYKFATKKGMAGIEGNSFSDFVIRNVSKDITGEVEKFVGMYDTDWNYTMPNGMDPLNLAAEWVNTQSLYPDTPQEMGAVLSAMVTRPIVKASHFPFGSQLKFVIELQGGQKVLFKPKRYDIGTVRENSYWGKDKFNAEIVAFHLNRLLNFRRTPIAVGRRLDLQKEFVSVADQQLAEGISKQASKPAVCIERKCANCTAKKGWCTQNTYLDGAFILMLPAQYHFTMIHQPWYDTRNVTLQKANDTTLCHDVMTHPVFGKGRIFLDLMDTSVMHYLISNVDGDHMEIFNNDPDSMVLLWDNGKSFGNPHQDLTELIEPLSKCCRIRHSTWIRLIKLANGVLSKTLKKLLEKDPLSPLLTEEHFKALDRRLKDIINVVISCVLTHGTQHTFVNDHV